MKPEQLKALAEWMGWTNELESNKYWTSYIFHPAENMAPIRITVDPLNNLSQVLEIQKKLLLLGWEIYSYKDEGSDFFTLHRGINNHVTEESFEQAIIDAALNHIASTDTKQE